MPWGEPLTLIGESPEQVADAQRQLVRIGVDQLAGAATGTPQELSAGHPTASYRRATFDELPEQLQPGPARPRPSSRDGPGR